MSKNCAKAKPKIMSHITFNKLFFNNDDMCRNFFLNVFHPLGLVCPECGCVHFTLLKCRNNVTRDLVYSKVEVLGAGADDYLCKPFELEELLARIQVQLRKRNKNAYENIVFKDLSLNQSLYDGVIDNEPLHLTKHEYLILEL